jgi:molybdenum cofactor synthesis domain-containing protein
METGTILAINISEKRGTVKHGVPEIELVENFGLKDDAHGGNWHRQVSLLSASKIAQFNEQGGQVQFGDFGENLVVEGIDCAALPVGTFLTIGEALLEVTQIGKKCHNECEIFHRVGMCIMPTNGIFARVLRGGMIQVKDTITAYPPETFRAAVLTVSDKGSKGQREDKSGPEVVRILRENGYLIQKVGLVPDEQELISQWLTDTADQLGVSLICTTGGTGFALRDITPEATLAVATRNAPGIAEAMRLRSLQVTDRAMLSRAASVIRNRTLIVNLPGSPKAVRECLEFVLAPLGHGLALLADREGECGQPVADK